MSDRRNQKPRRQNGERRTADRRTEPRESLETAIRFLRAGLSIDEVLTGDLVDVSPSGIRILLDTPLEQGDKFLVEVRGTEDSCFNLSAEAIWIEHLPNRKCLIGCNLYVSLTNRQYARLQELATRTAV